MTFRFLNETRVVEKARDWDDPGIDRLWRYHLHYFDDLNAKDSCQRSEWHCEWMDRWVAENPLGQGTGWESYPTSLRIINWIKWAMAGQDLSPACRSSLALQARWLADRLEIHLMGNHLFSNAKALVFAGLFFDGAEASCWLEKGFGVLKREIPEQILPDGGQFERSPMYHALVLEDMLDLCNVTAAFNTGVPPRWRAVTAEWPKVVGKMQHWLAVMCHPDREISFFNDATFGVASSLAALEAYADRLGLPPTKLLKEGVMVLPDSGYIRLQKGPVTALLDAASLGPDYQPGHGHADTLSFELSLFGQRVIVNSGVSCYGFGPERLRQRGTAAHSTVVVDNEDSSEVWGGFRVARRARPRILVIDETPDALRVAACHNGYERLRGRNIHTRDWIAQEGSFVVEDKISGPYHKAQARFHLHPFIRIGGLSASGDEAELEFPGGRKVGVSVEGGVLGLEVSIWHPAFGPGEPTQCLVAHVEGGSLRTAFKWSMDP